MSVVESLTSWASPQREPGAPESTRPHLRALDAPAKVVRIPFVAVLGALLALGLLGLLVLNTAIQTQAKQLNSLQADATSLGYQKGELTTQVEQLRSASALEQRAHQLGLRPNPYPAFITLADGRILGNPVPVTGNELPDQKWSSWQQQQDAQEGARAQVAAEAKAKADAARKKAEELRKKRAEEAKKKAAAAKASVKPSAKPSATSSTANPARTNSSTKPSTAPTAGGR
ncbi:hypothetical protein [Aestuariimicrobium sp. T2.26MG-19.2B]|uniref:hypothetical protein n=1 Tax=Aestuariimicrobium sp. T2.26MG-19.2B TaxID=3040679 RepID=UPI0024772F3D|nr:hypothetical protein [Aestuariimicrobium sp. T2.26MG-19.2B]CAI9399473.1 Cell division protein FtsL [Aestuariimicrobium sp. T2.26MG-19.2B]